MLQWISRFPVPKIYLSFLLLWLYYAIFSASFIALLGFVFLLLCLFIQYPWKIVIKVFLVSSLFASWFVYQKWQQEEASQYLVDSVQTVRILPDTIKVNGDSLSFRGKADGRIFQVYYKFESEAEKEQFQHLTDIYEIELEGKLSEPQGQRIFGGFDYQAYLKIQGIYQILNIKRIQSLKKVSSLDIGEHLSSLRRKAVVWIKTKFPDPMRNYMTGLLLGHLDTDFEEMNELYSSLGIIHLFALSGMQVGFFMNVFKNAVLRLGLSQEKFRWLAYPFSLIYAGLTGFSASVIRSLLQKLLAQHGFKGLENFALTILILFLVMPNFFLSTGGVLSCAYAFILTMTSKEEQGVKAILRESLIISLGILPILTFYFSEFQPWSILLTFAFSFLFDLVLLPLLSILFCLSFIYPVTQVNFIFEGLESIIRFVAQSTSKPIVFGQPSLWVLLALLLILALLYDSRKNCKRLSLLVFIVSTLFILTKYPLENEITLIDIGQGQSIFLRDLTGKTILIDVGKDEEDEDKEAWQEKTTSSQVQRNLIPYLKSRGVAEIDQLILTNSDDKQLENLFEVSRAFEIKEIILEEESLAQKDLLEKLKLNKMIISSIKTKKQISILGSQLNMIDTKKSKDKTSQTFLHGKLLDQTFLIARNLKEKDLLKNYPDLQADVVIMGQHDKKSSSNSELLKKLKSKITIISSEKKRRGNDSQSQLSSDSSKLYRLKQEGSLRFRGWNSWKLETPSKN
jgi:ComEC/Rec2-like protein